MSDPTPLRPVPRQPPTFLPPVPPARPPAGVPGPDPRPEPGAAPPWIDQLRGRLLEQRTILLRGPLDDVVDETAAALMTLDATGDDGVSLQLDSPGGSLDAAFALMDVIDLLGVPVEVRCVGRVEGTAVGVVAVCDHRVAAPHARFRLCEPRAEHAGAATDLDRWAQDHARRLERFHERVAAATGHDVGVVAADLAAGRWLDAGEARAYGLVDEVAATGRPGPSRVVGFRPEPGA